MTPDCKSCRHCITVWHTILNSKEDYCQSPQLAAFLGATLMCRLERSEFDPAWDSFRNTDAKRKCGPEGLNYEAKA